MEESRKFPEEDKIVNKSHFEGCTGQLLPGMADRSYTGQGMCEIGEAPLKGPV